MIKLKDLLKESIGGMVSIGVLNNPFPTHKKQIKEYIDLHDPVKDVKGHFAQFSKDMDNKRGGSFDGDSGEYHNFEGGDSKLYEKRYKNLTAWEKKVKKTLDGLMKDYVKAWK